MPRSLAANVLEDILHRRKSFDNSFSDHGGRAKLEVRDRAFAYNLVATTLRRLGQIDDLISQCLDRPLPKKARGAQTILRLGVAQLIFMNVSDHAAVDTSVNLAQDRKQGPYKKLINAVLRRLGREGASLLSAQTPTILNTPAWLWDSWITAYGDQAARHIAESHLQPPPLDISVNSSTETWAADLDGHLLPTGSIRITDHSGVEKLPGYKEGAWWVQDAAAALPVRLFRELAGQRIADLCAAPGGKTAQLASAGARVTAIDRSEKRMLLLQENMDRLSLETTCVVGDATQWRPDEPLDGVLIDAPCSATGTIRRHPDIPWIKSPADVGGVAKTQRTLLEASIEMVRPGGTIVFATCSLQPEEGPEAISGFLDSCTDVVCDPIGEKEMPVLPDCITSDGHLRTLPCFWPEEGGMDGFFAARLTRIH